ncbi:MAG: recombinase family protein [Pedobacter sp.]|nr:recombinase family protein [Chitinophagaceae bacterium]
MNNIDYFKKFMPLANDGVNTNFVVWSYTRVSSKEQFLKNSSVDNQIERNTSYAKENNYNIIEEFGGTYESGKSDFTRKEFKRLIDKIELSKKKPYAVLVFKMSRFSRSGGNAIGLVNHLVEVLGVNLIETSSGITTTTERGKAAIYESLFHAYKENLERKEIIIPNMKNFLRKGHIFGSAPLGYDHYGPRVKREGFLNTTQKIVINEVGRVLKEAWNWKSSGLYSDAQILNKLAARGMILAPQKLSKIWRNPFYCGILISKMLGHPQKGNWEPLISFDEFIKVQNVLENNHSGYEHNPESDRRPLTHLIQCNQCNSYLVGYEVLRKKLHYYKCPSCRGVSVNANSTPKSKKIGANNLFRTLLDDLALDEKLIPLLKLQLEKIFEHYNSGSKVDFTRLNNQLIENQSKKKQLKIRHGLGEIDKESYELTSEYLNIEINRIEAELHSVQPILSNQEEMIEISLKKASNINSIWDSSNLENKRILCKILFPRGLFYDPEKHEYLTKGMNQYFHLIGSLSKKYKANKKGNFQDLIENSLSVARTRFELVTSGL